VLCAVPARLLLNLSAKETRPVPAVAAVPVSHSTYVEAPTAPAVAHLIDDCLRRHLSEAAVPRVREAVLRGQVVHLTAADTHAPVVAYKRGVLFVAGTEYVIDEE
jgi:hypothetical protein